MLEIYRDNVMTCLLKFSELLAIVLAFADAPSKQEDSKILSERTNFLVVYKLIKYEFPEF